jgi:hypothetical protein
MHLSFNISSTLISFNMLFKDLFSISLIMLLFYASTIDYLSSYNLFTFLSSTVFSS